MRSFTSDMAVDVPEGGHGAVTVERFTIGTDDFQNFRMGGRAARPGTYTMLCRKGELWMSDTTAERMDHFEAAREIDARGGRILIGGLGLGMILRVALLTPKVAHIDVVEIDPDVIALVGPHYQAMAAARGKSLSIIQADLTTVKWPPQTRWDVAWFDIWPDLCTDALDSMAALRRSYGRRADWCECWGREWLLDRRRREKRMGW